MNASNSCESNSLFARDCAHPISSSLALKLDFRKPCPLCLIEGLVCKIHRLQLSMVVYGGVFKQRKDEPDMHTLVKKEWVAAKVQLQNSIDQFEVWLKDDDMGLEDQSILEKALKVWEMEREQLSRVPGVRMSIKVEEKEPSEEDKEGARLLMVWLKMVVEKEMAQDELEEVAAPAPTLVTPPQNSSCSSLEQVSKCATPSPPKTPTTPPPVTIQQKVTTPKSSLKRPLTSSPPGGSPSTSLANKRVHIADCVTISPSHLNVIDPLLFDYLPYTPVTATHAAHTTAEHSRPQHMFHRGTRYVPGAWASSASNEKANTSFFGIPDEDMNKLVQGDIDIAKEEKVIVNHMKLVAWWTTNMVPKLDLERFMAKMA